MRIIPVIDIKDGIVVHARRGERAAYRPLHTRFASVPEPAAVVAGMLAFRPFDTIYIADLDAIAGGAGNAAVVEHIAARHAGLDLWLDAGFRSAEHIATCAAIAGVHIVLASEAVTSLDHYRALGTAIAPARTVLSLDRADGGVLGCAALFTAVELWPERIIHMNLARVGADAGPDWDGLAQLRARAGARHIYAAGGVRDEADLRALATHDISGALVATALHDGRINVAAIDRT